MNCNLKATPLRASRSALILSNLYQTREETAICELLVNTVTQPLDLATQVSYMIRNYAYFDLTFDPLTLNMCHMLRSALE